MAYSHGPDSSGPSDDPPHVPAEEALTEVAPSDAPTEVAPSDAPTEVARPHPPTDVAPPPATDVSPHAPTEVTSHPPTEVAPHPPTEVASHPPTEVASHPPTEVDVGFRPTDGPGRAPGAPAAEAETAAAEVWQASHPPVIVRYGPGVPVGSPAGQPGLTAEHVWRGTRPAEPSRPRSRLRQLGRPALTVILLAASGVILYLRFVHPPLQVTGVAVSQHARPGCAVDLTGQVTTSGGAGTISYQWVFQSGPAPRPLSQSVAAGQQAVDVTATVEGIGYGSKSQTATLQVLGPDRRAASERIALSC